MAELSCQVRDVVSAMSAEERESASIKLLQKLLQEKHSVSEDTVQERKREIKDLYLKELELAREEDEKEVEEAEEEESNERETKTPVRKSSFCMCMCFFLLLIRNREWSKFLRGAFSSELVWMCVCLWGICLLFLFHF